MDIPVCSSENIQKLEIIVTKIADFDIIIIISGQSGNR
jgi:hypothetical protein